MLTHQSLCFPVNKIEEFRIKFGMPKGGGGPMASALPTFKLLLMGDSGTGKSSLLLRFTDDKFLGEDVQAATIGTKGI